MVKRIMLSLGLLFLVVAARGQYGGPDIGERLPEISLRIVYPKQEVVTTESLHGKPFILCFISKGCMGAFQLLPEANVLYEKFRDRVNMIMIPIDRRDSVMAAYRQYQKNYNLIFWLADDQVVHQQLGVKAVPHLLWVNAAGRVEAISHVLEEATLSKFAAGEPLHIPNPLRPTFLTTFDRSKPLLVSNNGGSDTAFFQRSLFARWKPGMPNITLNSDYTRGDAFYNIDMLQLSGRRLKELYRIAYIGKSKAWQSGDSTAHGIYRYQPILAVADSTLFMDDRLNGTNLYCYSQTLPPARRTRDNMMRVMQADLKNCFGYDVTLETRRTFYWRLIAGKRAAHLLRPRAQQGTSYGDMMSGGKFYGFTMPGIVEIINYAGQLIINDRPLIDETGITGKIDIQLDAVMTDLEDVRRALRPYDLHIVAGERDMKVIVIRDPVITSNE